MHFPYFQLCRFRRQTHVTPKSYLSFINGYETIYSEKRAEIGELANRMKTGLDKLIEASESVAQLSKELVVKEKDLAVASVKADTVLHNFSTSLCRTLACEKVTLGFSKYIKQSECGLTITPNVKAKILRTE